MKNPFSPLFERRSIGSSSELLQYLTGGSQTVAGVTVTEATALQVATVRSCVDRISSDLATLPIAVMERRDRERVELDTHPLARLFDNPNSWQVWPEFVQMMQAHVLLRGNAYAWINRSANGVITELIPMHPDAVKVKQLPTYRLRYELFREGKEPVVFDQGEVFHLRGLSTDGVMGRSVLHDARETFGGALATQEHANALWSRDATPSVTLEHPGRLGDKARKNLEESWETVYGQGKDKRRVAVLEEGMKIQQLSLTPNDGQFIETQNLQDYRICGMFRVPPFMVGLTEKQTSWGTGIEQQKIGYWQGTIQPWAVRWEKRLKRDMLASSSPAYVRFNLSAQMRGDSTARSNYYWRMVQMGAMSPNDVRAFEDLNPIADGDVYLQPTNMAPLGSNPLEPAGHGAQEP